MISHFFRLLTEKKRIESQTEETKRKLEQRVHQLEEELDTAKRQITATVCGGEAKKEKIEEEISDLESQLRKDQETGKVCHIIVTLEICHSSISDVTLWNQISFNE